MDSSVNYSKHCKCSITKEELFERMKEIMKKLSPDVDYDKKLEALQYLTHICNTYPTKFDLNIRTLIHSINLRAHNEELIRVGDQEVPVWKLLIKKYLKARESYKNLIYNDSILIKKIKFNITLT